MYVNDHDVHFDAHDDKRGTTHIDIYSGDPKEEHDSIHLNIKDDGTARITEKFDGDTETSYVDFNKE
jgi:hypothetical protein